VAQWQSEEADDWRFLVRVDGRTNFGIESAAIGRGAFASSRAVDLAGARRGVWGEVLNRPVAAGVNAESATDPDVESARRARKAAEDFVSIAFVQPILKEFRASNRAAAPFAPGPAERSFGALLDQVMAGEVVRASKFGLVDRLAGDLNSRRLKGRGGGEGGGEDASEGASDGAESLAMLRAMGSSASAIMARGDARQASIGSAVSGGGQGGRP